MTNWFLKISKTRFSLGLPVLMIMPLYVLSYLNINEIKRALFNNANQLLENSANQSALKIDLFLKNTLEKISTESRFEIFLNFLKNKNSKKTNEILNILNLLKNKDEMYILSYAILDAQGNNIADTDKNNIGKSEKDQPYFYKIQNNIFHSFHQMIFEKDGRAYLIFISPILDFNNTFVGALRVKYSPVIFQILISSDYGLAGQRSFGILINEYNLILANSKNSSDIFKFYIKPQLPNNLSLKNLIEQKSLPSFTTNNMDSNNIMYEFETSTATTELQFKATASLNYNLWKVIYFQSNDALVSLIYKKIFKIILYANIIFIITLILAIGIIKLLKALQSNQRELNEAHQKLAQAYYQEQQWAEYIKKDLELSMKVQDSLLQVPKIPSEFQLFCHHLPARYLSGDTYFINWDDKLQILTVILMDVVGKGVQAALKACVYQQIAKNIWNNSWKNKNDYQNFKTFEQEIYKFLNSFPDEIKDFNAMIGFELYVRENKMCLYRSNYNYPILIQSTDVNDIKHYEVKNIFIPNKKPFVLNFYPNDAIILLSDGYLSSHIKLAKLTNSLSEEIHKYKFTLNSSTIYSLINNFEHTHLFNNKNQTLSDDKTLIILYWDSVVPQNSIVDPTTNKALG